MFDEASLTSLVARHHTLNGFVEAVSEADGVGLTDVDALTTLVVCTDNSVYQITILQGHTREVLGIGLHMEFHFVDQWMITSHVREIAIEPVCDHPTLLARRRSERVRTPCVVRSPVKTRCIDEGRYTMTYTKVGDEWRIIMQHNTPAGEDPQPVRGLRDGAPVQ